MTKLKRIIASIQGLNWSRYWVIYYITYLGSGRVYLVGGPLLGEALQRQRPRISVGRRVRGFSGHSPDNHNLGGGPHRRLYATDSRSMELRLQKGVQRGVQSQLDRTEEAYRKFGIDVDGVRVLPDTPEVRRFLAGKSNGKSGNDA